MGRLALLIREIRYVGDVGWFTVRTQGGARLKELLTYASHGQAANGLNLINADAL